MGSYKNFAPTKLLWIDLEMTGLDPVNDVVIEVAAEITDMQFQTLATYEALIKHPKKIVLERMNKNTWWKDYPENRDTFIKGLENARSVKIVEQELIELVEKYFGSTLAVIAGNSIHNDRNFIKETFPELETKLHYRMVDVSSFKIVMQSRYKVYFEKPEVHRAFDDVQASIAELQYYTSFFKETDGPQNR